MKKIISLALFIFFIWNNSFSQADFRFGFQVSPTFNFIASDENDIKNNGTVVGLKLGMLGEYYFRENYAFTGGIGFAFNSGGKMLYDPEGVYWSQSDHTVKGDTLTGGANLRYGVQYVEIPFGLKMTTRYFGQIRAFAEIPVFTIGVKTQARGDISGTSRTTGDARSEDKIDIKKEVNPLNLSWGLGGGAEYEISESTSIVAGLFYQQGFLDMTDKDGTDFKNNEGSFVDDDSKITLRNITLRIGVNF